MGLLDREEINEVFERFINERDQFWAFKDWIEQQGYSLEEFGMKED